MVGGRASSAYRQALEKTGAVQTPDLEGLCATLDDLRKPSAKPKP